MISWVSGSIFGGTARVTPYVDVSLEQVIRRDLWSGFGGKKESSDRASIAGYRVFYQLYA